MPTAHVADIHFSAKRLEPTARAFAQVYEICAARSISTVVIDGDLLEDGRLAMGHDSTAGDIQGPIITPMTDHPDIETLVVLGNHDLGGGPGHKSGCEFLKGIPGVTVIETPQLIRRPHANIACIPWAWNSWLLSDPAMRALSREDFLKRATELRERIVDMLAAQWADDQRTLRVLAGHAEVAGAINRYMPLPPGQYHVYSIDTLRRAKADAICFGHYHRRQAIDGTDVYVGALCQQNAGEQDNPTGFLILHDDGRREWVHIDSPRFITVKTMAELDALDRRPQDDIKFQAELKPAELPDGVRFDPVLAPKETRQRAEGLPVDVSPLELLHAWLVLQGTIPSDPTVRVEVPRALVEALEGLMMEIPLPVQEVAQVGCLEAIREIRLKGIGPHVDTVIEIPPAADGVISFQGEEGAGKTFGIEAPAGCWWGEWPSYPGPAYDNVPPAWTDLSSVEILFEANGKTFRSVRRIHQKGKQKLQECVLFQVEPGKPDFPITDSKGKTFAAEIGRILGSKQDFLAVVQQPQSDETSIVDLDPSDRMSIMRRWTNADRFGPHSDVADKRLAQHRTTLAVTETKLATAALAAADLEPAQEELDKQQTLMGCHEQTVQDVTRQGHEAADALAQAKADIAAVAAIERQRAEAEAAAGAVRIDIHSAQATIAHLEAAEQGRPALLEAQVALGTVQAELETLQAEQDRIGVLAGLHMQKVAILNEAETECRGWLNVTKDSRAATLLQLNEAAAAIRAEMEKKKQAARRDLYRQQATVQDLQRRMGLLDKAGCKAQPLVCSFIDDAKVAAGELPAAQDRLNELDAAWEFRAWAAELTPKLELVLADIAAMPTGLPELPENLVQKRAQAEAEAVAMKALIPTSKTEALNKLRNEVSKLWQSTAELAKLDVQKARLGGERERLEHFQAELAGLEVKLATIEVPDRTTLAARLESCEATIGGLRKQLQDANMAVRDTAKLVGAAQERLTRATAAAADRLALATEADTDRSTVQTWTTLAEFLSPWGAPQLLIDMATPRLNQIMADLMDAMQDTRFRVWFSTTRPNKDTKRGSREGFFINVEDINGCRDIKKCSGGEKKRLRQAIRFTFGLWQAERRGSHHKVYLLDEPTLGMSPRGAQRFVNTIFRVAERFRQIWIVSHDPVVLSACPTGFRFVRENDTSPTQVEQVLKPIQQIEPIGVAAN